MNEYIGQLGVGGIFAVLIIRSFIDFVKYKKNGKNNGKEDIDIIKDKTIKLFEMHNHYDNDGVPSWFTPRYLVVTQKEIIGTQRDITDLIKDISNSQEKIAEALTRIEGKDC